MFATNINSSEKLIKIIQIYIILYQKYIINYPKNQVLLNEQRSKWNENFCKKIFTLFFLEKCPFFAFFKQKSIELVTNRDRFYSIY